MVLRVVAGVVALIVVFSPSGMIEGFIGEGPVEAELVRWTAAVVLLLATFSVLVRVRGLVAPPTTRVVIGTGVLFLVMGVAGREMVFTFFAFPFLSAGMLGTGMVLADAWRENVISTHRLRRR